MILSDHSRPQEPAPEPMPELLPMAGLVPQDLRKACAEIVWQGMDARQRRATLWDEPEHARAKLFAEKVFPEADLAGAGYMGSPALPVAQNLPRAEVAAWIQGTAKGSRTGMIHFASATRDVPKLLAYGRAFLYIAACYYDVLLCAVPMPWRGARAYVRALGFAPLIHLRKASFIAAHKRNVDCMLFGLSKAEAAAANGGENEARAHDGGERENPKAQMP